MTQVQIKYKRRLSLPLYAGRRIFKSMEMDTFTKKNIEEEKYIVRCW